MTYRREVPPVPPIPGWHVDHDEHNLVANRLSPLSEYQREYGALDQVDARSMGELWMLADAQTRLAERLRTAEEAAAAHKAQGARNAAALHDMLGTT